MSGFYTDLIYDPDFCIAQNSVTAPDSAPITQPSRHSHQNPASNPAPSSTQYHTPPTTPLFTSDLASQIIVKSLSLNEVLTDLSHKLHQVQRAIESLRNAINSAVDPKQINVNTQETETEEEHPRRAGVEQDKKEETGLTVEVEPKEPVVEEEEKLVEARQVAQDEMRYGYTEDWPAYYNLKDGSE
jgi:hypothetical protein